MEDKQKLVDEFYDLLDRLRFNFLGNTPKKIDDYYLHIGKMGLSGLYCIGKRHTVTNDTDKHIILYDYSSTDWQKTVFDYLGEAYDNNYEDFMEVLELMREMKKFGNSL